MLKSELLEIISNGENSGVDFKRDDIRPEQLAKEVVAFANVQGGRILLGVENDGTITGLQRGNTEEWVMNVFRDKVHPLIIPFYEEILFDGALKVGVITIGPGISKPYMMLHDGKEEAFVRMGSVCERATREQLARLFEIGGLLHTEVLPVAGTSFTHLDLARLTSYLHDIIKDPSVPTTDLEWIERLVGLGFMAEDGLGSKVCSVAGLVCFGIAPRRFLRSAGLRIMVFSSLDKEYQALLDEILDAPLTGRWQTTSDGQKQLADAGIIEKFINIIEPFLTIDPVNIDEDMRREKVWHYPYEAIREAVINALAHRDWTRSVDIEISCYADRMEIISPGRLQNSMTISKMLAGQRSPRNPLIMDVLRDCGYVDSRGMGVRTKIIPLMQQINKTEPIFEATEDYLRVVLYKKAT